MEISIDPNQRRFLSGKVRSGQFKSTSDVVKFAIDRLRQDDRDMAWLKREVQKGIDSLDDGEGEVWDVEKEKARFLRRIKRQRSRG